MTESADSIDRHPLVEFADRREWDYSQLAAHFGLEYGVLKKIVRGFTGCSFSRAEHLASRSSGEFQAVDVMRWHQRNRREASS